MSPSIIRAPQHDDRTPCSKQSCGSWLTTAPPL
jgi:hypothetical protein